jgi:glutamate racemase
MNKDPKIDTIILACTHYPVIKKQIEQLLGPDINVIAQGPIVAEKLADYLLRHHELANRLTSGSNTKFFTTENSIVFDEKATQFLNELVVSEHVEIAI